MHKNVVFLLAGCACNALPEHTVQLGADAGYSELKTIMLLVQNIMKNMDTQFSQFEKSLKDLKELNSKVV